ncbi:MAG: single-stranded DNA-binding protein [Caudoviricetes sp.]|nr:MAG: single-stranded DNA-binding protein [Caudoviricetes sp.]
MSLEVTGKLIKFLEVESGESKSGTTWSKQQFVVQTESQYNNLYCFEVFGNEKVENLTKYQKEGDNVTVEFNVNTNEYKGKYYTSLSAWKISKANSNGIQSPEQPQGNGFPPAPNFNKLEVPEDDSLPF